jgi:hypothetical protein
VLAEASRRRLDDNTNSGGTFYFSSLADYQSGQAYSFTQQVGNGHVAFLEKVTGFFVQDEIRVSPRSLPPWVFGTTGRTIFTTTTTSDRERRLPLRRVPTARL